jgi:hypothetical protein
MKNSKMFLIAAALVSVALSSDACASAELVANGGFETGDFSYWTVDSETGWFPTVDDDVLFPNYYPHSGNYYGDFGVSFGGAGLASMASIAQAIPTTIGLTYHVEFWLKTTLTYPGVVSATFGDTSLLSLTTISEFDYTLFEADIVATSVSSVLIFSGNTQSPFPIYLDDVSVTQVGPVVEAPETSTSVALAFLAGVTGFTVWRRRAQRPAQGGSK